MPPQWMRRRRRVRTIWRARPGCFLCMRAGAPDRRPPRGRSGSAGCSFAPRLAPPAGGFGFSGTSRFRSPRVGRGAGHARAPATAFLLFSSWVARVLSLCSWWCGSARARMRPSLLRGPRLRSVVVVTTTASSPFILSAAVIGSAFSSGLQEGAASRQRSRILLHSVC